MADLRARLAALTAEQRDALLQRLRETSGTTPRTPHPTALPRLDDTVPLSSTQRRMWFLEQLRPGLPLHVMSGVARLPVVMDPVVFAECLEEVVARHESLRTSFVVEAGAPVGRVRARPEVDLRVLEAIDTAAMWRTFTEDARRPFDITTGPLLRATFAVTADAQCYVQLTLHHLVSDGFSTGILFEELGTLCAGRYVSSRAMLAPLPFQYGDVAAWQASRLAAGDLDDAIGHWTETLRGAPQVLSLPTDRPRPARMSHRGERERFDLDADTVAAVRALAHQHQVTPFVVHLAAFAITLGRWAGQDDLVVGVPVAQRERPGTDKVIGPFLNTLALRIDLAAEDREPGDAGERRGASGAEVLRRVGAAVQGGLAHQEAPFDEVITATGVTRDPSRPALVQAVFNLQPERVERGLELTDLPNGCAQVDVLVNLVADASGVHGVVDYATDLFDASTVRRLVQSHLAVLRALTEDATTPVGALPLVPATDLRGAGPEPVVASVTGVHTAVLDAVRRHPDRTALVDGRQSLTYAELERRSRRLAVRLRQLLDAPPGAHVAVCLPRSVDVVVAILAVLRAGHTYVPLDPGHPRSRLALICADAGVAAVVSTSDLRAVLPELDGPRIDLDDLDLDDLDHGDTATVHESDPGTAVLDAADGGRAAYTIYTSGSTGRPKGVRVSHDNVVTFLDAMRAEPGLGPDDVLLSVTTPAFDIAVLEMLLPLTVGARTVFADSGDVVDGRRLARLLDQHAVTTMQATPATWRLMIASGWRGSPTLVALCGGEALPVSLAADLLPRCGALWNLYGPTETTVWSSAHRVTSADLEAGTVPLGHPIRGTALLVLDQGLNPVPRGVYGELCIAGSGVSLGYLERPELEGRFVAARAAGGARVYRTGDLVRTRPDGRLEFGGRLDAQVKVRGFRIEPGEVEAALDACPGVARSVVVTGSGPDGEPVLVGHLEPEPGATVDLGTVRAGLVDRLPTPMLPARLTVLERLPTTPNGKLDRAALAARADDATAAPDASVASMDRTRPRVAPRTELEATLADVWRDVLGLPEPPGVLEDFFELGGHSLLATQLVFRVREVLGADLPLTALFSGAVSIASLATLLTAGPRAGTGDAPPERLDLATEARLADDVRPAPGAHVHAVADPQHVLLTGATGFVGAFLLRELLEHSAATVSCLVRAGSRTEGLARIRETMTTYEIWEASYAERIVPVPGSLARPRLGLSRAAWDHLAASVDSIHHCGAEVNFLRPYESLKAANVSGTEEILRLACTGSVKPVHFVSTTYVFSRFNYPSGARLTEDMAPIHDLDHTFGYTQTKWVSERLVLEAGRRGLPVHVYRTGRVTGHSVTGACQVYDFVWQATRLGIRLGAAPVLDMSVDMTPVDYVVAAIVHLSRQAALRGQVFHVVSTAPMAQAELVEWMADYGYVGEQTTYAEWCARVVERAATLDDDASTALAPFLSGVLPLDRLPKSSFDDAHVREGLRGSGIECPEISGDLLRTYFDWFVSTGYLPSPREAMAATASGASA